MKRSDLEHLLRAAGRVIDADQIIVVDSQAILATIPDFMLPPEATMSVEADLIPLDGTEALGDQIDGAIGEASMFHQTFGVYAQGVGYETITAPDGWRDRLIAYSNDNTDGVTGLCLEINDLWLTKLAPADRKTSSSAVRSSERSSSPPTSSDHERRRSIQESTQMISQHESSACSPRTNRSSCTIAARRSRRPVETACFTWSERWPTGTV